MTPSSLTVQCGGHLHTTHKLHRSEADCEADDIEMLCVNFNFALLAPGGGQPTLPQLRPLTVQNQFSVDNGHTL